MPLFTTTRRLPLLLAAALVATGLAACSSDGDAAGQQSETRTVQTHYGDVEVPVDPQRVVAVSYETPWQLRSVGVTPVGAQDYSAYAGQLTPEDEAFVADIPSVGAFFDLNLEAVLAAEPDLIVGDALEIDADLYAQLSAIAPTAIFSGEYRGDWRAVGEGVADAVNASATFEKLSGEYDARLTGLQDEYATEIGDLRWAAVSEGDQGGGFSILYPTGVLGALWFQDLGVTLAPGVPASNDNGFDFVAPELTEDVLGEADVIIVPAQADGTLNPVLTALVEEPLFATLPASQSGDVYWLYSTVTDYTSALAWLDKVEDVVLAPLAAK